MTGFCECLQAMAALLGAHWNDVHPKGYEGDFTLRQNTISGLEDRTTVVLPLQYAPLLRDQRAGPISLRDYMISIGKAQPREEERTIDVNQILETFRSESHRAEVDALARSDHRRPVVAYEDQVGLRRRHELRVLARLRPAARRAFGRLNFIETARPDLRSATAGDRRSRRG